MREYKIQIEPEDEYQYQIRLLRNGATVAQFLAPLVTAVGKVSDALLRDFEDDPV